MATQPATIPEVPAVEPGIDVPAPPEPADPAQPDEIVPPLPDTIDPGSEPIGWPPDPSGKVRG
jgi:hypothetical protein